MAKAKTTTAPMGVGSTNGNGNGNGHVEGLAAELLGGAAPAAAADGEHEQVVTRTTTRIRKAKAPAKRKAPPASEDDASALHELELLQGGESSGTEVTVTRVGPPDYHGKPVQLGYCGKLAAGTASPVEATKLRWQGGWYEMAYRGSDGHVHRPVVKIPGRPAPLDAQEQRDQEDADAARAYGGFAGFGQAAVGGPFAAGFGVGTGIESLGHGWVWLSNEQRYVWTGPGPCLSPPPPPPGQQAQYVHPPTAEIEALKTQNQELLRRLDAQAHDVKLGTLEAKIEALLNGGGTKARSYEELREEREAERDARREEREAERAAAVARREAEDLQRREERESRDRFATLMQTMGAEQQKMLLQVLTTQKPTNVLDVVQQAHALKGLVADDSKAAEVERMMGAGERLFSTAVATIRGGAAPAAGATAGAIGSAPSAAGGDAMARALEYLLTCFKKGNDPRDTVALLLGFCSGAGLDAASTRDTLSALTLDQVLSALVDAEKKATADTHKVYLRECHAALSKPEGAKWYGEFVAVLKQT